MVKKGCPFLFIHIVIPPRALQDPQFFLIMSKVNRRQRRLIKESGSVASAQGLIDYTLIRSNQRRTLCISINEKASVSVYAPIRTPNREIESFLREKSRWIVDKVREAQKNQQLLSQKKFIPGQKFLFLGRKCRIEIIPQKIKKVRVEFDAHRWNISVPSHLTENERHAQIKKKMVQWYRHQAKEILGGKVFHFSRLIGVEPKKIVVRTQKRQWGSCDAHQGLISLNWQIVQSPEDVIDYIIVHELCHLAIPNHSKRFWKRVQKFLPEYKNQKDWLKRNSLDMVLP